MKRNSKIIVVSIISGFICILMYFLSQMIVIEREHIYILCSLITFIYFFTLKQTVDCNGTMSLVTLFWICLGLFAIARPIMYVLGMLDFTNEVYSIIGKFQWSYNTTVTVLHAYIIFMIVFANINCAGKEQEKTIIRFYEKESLFKPFLKIMYFVFYICVPIVAYNYFAQVFIVRKLGYTSYYNGSALKALSFGIVFSLARLALTVSFYVICCTEKRIRYFDLASVIYLLTNGVLVLQGSRAAFLVSLLTYIFLRYRIHGKIIKFKWFFLAFLLAIPLLQMISYIRSNETPTLNMIPNSYRDFFSELSLSFNVPAYYLEHKNELSGNTYPYIFEPLVKAFQYFKYKNIYTSGQSTAMVAVRFNLGHQITNNISESYYLSGSNVASNFIAEMLEFGLVGVLLFSIVVSKIIGFSERKIITGGLFMRYMSFELCRWVFLLPRSETFYDTYSLLKYGLIFLIMIIIARIIRVKGKNKNEELQRN